MAIGIFEVMNSGRKSPAAFWGAFTGHAVLPFAVVSGALRKAIGFSVAYCLEDPDIFSMRYSPAAAYGLCFFILALWACYQMAPEVMWRPAFLGVFLLVISPALSHSTGEDIFYGPWAMFGGGHEGWDPTFLGGAAIFLGGLAVAALLMAPSREVVSFELNAHGVRPSLALVRILLAFWIMEHVHWGGDDSPFSKWWSPQLLPGGGGALGFQRMWCQTRLARAW